MHDLNKEIKRKFYISDQARKYYKFYKFFIKVGMKSEIPFGIKSLRNFHFKKHSYKRGIYKRGVIAQKNVQVFHNIV